MKFMIFMYWLNIICVSYNSFVGNWVFLLINLFAAALLGWVYCDLRSKV